MRFFVVNSACFLDAEERVDVTSTGSTSQHRDWLRLLREKLLCKLLERVSFLDGVQNPYISFSLSIPFVLPSWAWSYVIAAAPCWTPHWPTYSWSKHRCFVCECVWVCVCVCVCVRVWWEARLYGSMTTSVIWHFLVILSELFPFCYLDLFVKHYQCVSIIFR